MTRLVCELQTRLAKITLKAFMAITSSSRQPSSWGGCENIFSGWRVFVQLRARKRVLVLVAVLWKKIHKLRK